jgi:hypothetical protein
VSAIFRNFTVELGIVPSWGQGFGAQFRTGAQQF